MGTSGYLRGPRVTRLCTAGRASCSLAHTSQDSRCRRPQTAPSTAATRGRRERRPQARVPALPTLTRRWLHTRPRFNSSATANENRGLHGLFGPQSRVGARCPPQPETLPGQRGDTGPTTTRPALSPQDAVLGRTLSSEWPATFLLSVTHVASSQGPSLALPRSGRQGKRSPASLSSQAEQVHRSRAVGPAWRAAGCYAGGSWSSARGPVGSVAAEPAARRPGRQRRRRTPGARPTLHRSGGSPQDLLHAWSCCLQTKTRPTSNSAPPDAATLTPAPPNPQTVTRGMKQPSPLTTSL